VNESFVHRLLTDNASIMRRERDGNDTKKHLVDVTYNDNEDPAGNSRYRSK